MRTWIGTALLSGSWLWGLGYFQPAAFGWWLVMLLGAVGLLTHLPLCFPKRTVRMMALLLLMPVAVSLPVPYNAGPALLAVGLLLTLLPIPRRWPERLSRGTAVCGMLLLGQTVVMITYQFLTAREHALPKLLGHALGLLPRLAGFDTAVDGTELVVRGGSSQAVRVGLTWEVLLDPASACFIAGAAIAIYLVTSNGLRRPAVGRSWLRGLWLLFMAWLVWAPIRLALLVSLVLHQSVAGETTNYRNAGELLVSHWLQVILLTALAILTARFVRVPGQITTRRSSSSRIRACHPVGGRQLATVAVLVGIGTVILATGYYLVPIGQRKAGRIMVVERHSTWEPTTYPYDRQRYGEAGSYNYAAIFDYSNQYYDMSRLLETERIDRQKLDQCDVLIIKTPTERYTAEETKQVLEFVQRGGSLLLIGDHTNVFNMNTYLNDLSRPIGFTFRHDLLFQISDPYRQVYEPPWVPHPIVQHVPPMHFAVSCSIAPGASIGRMAVQNVGLWSLPPAYHESNYHPQAEYRPFLESGAWCQMWATAYGKGRVVAFTDSTLFSNFCVFQPGKRELFMGMLEWLNHTSRWDRAGARVGLIVLSLVVGGILVAAGIQRSVTWRGGWVFLLAVVCFSWTATALGMRTFHQFSMPWPPRVRSMPHVVIDRTISTVPLFTGAFADDETGFGYGMLEQWIPRIGNFISRESGPASFQGDALVLICPTQIPSGEFRRQLMEYVKAGGRVLIVDTPDLENSTANSLLPLFGMHSVYAVQPPADVPVRLLTDEVTVPIQASTEIVGGIALARWGQIPVAARKSVGKGTVTAIGFGSLFNDASMGFHWLAEPEPEVLRRYELLYGLLHAALQAELAPQAEPEDPPVNTN